MDVEFVLLVSEATPPCSISKLRADDIGTPRSCCGWSLIFAVSEDEGGPFVFCLFSENLSLLEEPGSEGQGGVVEER